MGEPKRRATYDDLMKVPDTKVAEIVDGVLYVTPRPASPHAVAGSVIVGSLMESFHRPPGDRGRPGGWWMMYEPELHFGDDVIVPDVAGWRHERMAQVPNVAAFTLAPDWVCEVASPRTGALDRARKMPIYAREGVASMWIVEPIARTVEVYRLEAGRWVVAATHGGSEPFHAEPFEALEIETSRLWLPSAGEPQQPG